ncbi:MAG: hypothetical protein DCC75_02760 [Proteobacteria bacterium]|nr:MAG: hypothetical protein DCC75_02760 [Pseudomonadota bacterium]
MATFDTTKAYKANLEQDIKLAKLQISGTIESSQCEVQTCADCDGQAHRSGQSARHSGQVG